MGLDPDEWRAPSRCDGWTVKDVVAHLTSVNHFWTASVTAGVAGTPTRWLEGFDPVTTPSAMVDQTRDLEADEVLERFVSSNEALLGVLSGLDDAGWEEVAEAPPGHIATRAVASHALWDCWIHERDIGIPLGRTPPVLDDEVSASLRYVCALSAAFGVIAGRPVQGRFALSAVDPELSFVIEVGETVVVRDGAVPSGTPVLHGDAVALLEALSVRAPIPAGVPDGWLSLVQGLATAFDAA